MSASTQPTGSRTASESPSSSRSDEQKAPGRLLCVGDLVADMTVVPEGGLVPGSDSPGRVELAAGGSAANVAAAAAREGVDARFAGVMGDDLLGRMLVDDLAGHGVDVRPVLRSHTSSRAIVAIVDAASGDRSMVSDLSTPTSMTVDDVDTSWFRDVTWLHVTAYTWFAPGGPEVWSELIGRATKAGVGWSVDLSSARMIEAAGGAPAVSDALDGAAVLFPSNDEAEAATGSADPVAAATALLDLAEVVALTCGPDGAVVARRRGSTFTADAHPGPVVNALGCGDAFAGGFLAARISGHDDRTCCDRALAAAARVLALRTAR